MRLGGFIHILYVWLIVGLSAWQLHLLIPALDVDRVRELITIVFLGVLAEWLAVPYPYGRLSGGFALLFTTYLVFGQAATAWVAALTTLFGQGIANRGNPLRTTFFNAGQYVLAVVAAGFIEQAITGTSLNPSGVRYFVALAAFTVTYIIVNHLLVNIYLLPKRRYQTRPVWLDAFKWDSLTYLLTVPLGSLMVMIYGYIGLTGIVLLFSAVLVLQLIMRYYVHLSVANRELKTFYEVAALIEKNPEPAKLFKFILNEAAAIFPFHTGVVYLRSGEKDMFVPAAVTGLYAEQLDATTVYLGEGIIGRSLKEGTPVIIPDSKSDAHAKNEAGLGQVFRSLLIIPLLSGKEALGVMVLGDRKPAAFEPKHRRIVTVLAGLASLVLEKSFLAGRLEHVGSLDALTGLFHSGVFFQTLSEVCAAADDRDEAVGLIMIDVDHFQSFNDRYGRPAGDLALAELGGMIKGATSGDDLPARYGGDEFGIILPGAYGRRLLDIAEDLRDGIKAHYFLQQAGRQARITVSIGVAEYPRDAGDATGLFVAAQRALDKARKDGGDQAAAAAVSIIE